MIKLKDLREKDLITIENASKQLNQKHEKLDCTDVYGLEHEELEALFSHIRHEWLFFPELYNFIDTTTFASHKQKNLRIQLKNFVDQKRINNQPTPLNKSRLIKLLNQRKVFIIPIGIIGVICIAGIALTTNKGKFLTCEDANYTRHYTLTNPLGKCYKDLNKTPLTIGILTDAKYYEKFKEYLSNQLESTVKDVKIESVNRCYEYARNKIASKDWDVVFTLSPMNSIAASDNGYTWVARMFPDKPEYYQAALYTKKNSSINSIKELNSSHKIALGCIGSASSFYMPIYQLYGKTLNITKDYRDRELDNLVIKGNVDVSARAASFVDETKFKIIHKSSDIPGSGVYLSPDLAPEIQQQIINVMKNAPLELKKEANYGDGKEPNWTEFRKIANKAEEIVQCKNLTQNPVKLFGCQCPIPQVKGGIVGKVDSFVKINAETLQLNVNDEQGNTYYLKLEPKILGQVKNGTTPLTIKGKTIIINDVNPKSIKSNLFEIDITNSKQIQVLEGC
ncbi:hypothetical protein C7H19_15555 [Aphanothece hegewaldii CCALA 016]|uniref:Uncharacterized protein n=1 Tax=Aphanothece hegewaldii CCALA 016 TaxID=2107694 RepID=A0A2T1LVB6_9CHRO|nr:PhnD/SsuA/transferrin family substrate-binding protein [Aphanothece hegewaldii]PSF35657.1 hypothetical protein C7H19_15555 [Aphanothece hegewaldii CCALA 016]